MLLSVQVPWIRGFPLLHITDTHAHIDRINNPDESLKSAQNAGVTRVVAIGMDPPSTDATIEIANRHADQIRIAVGLHPHLADQTEDLWDAVVERANALAESGILAGIGETGFDRFRSYSEPTNQLDAFQRHCVLARELNMPLIIHSRSAEVETLQYLETYASDLSIVLHCFALPDHIDDVLERGYYCSFAGNVTYPSAVSLRQAVALIPSNRLLVETDAPFLAPVPQRGKPNHPELVAHTFAAVAKAADIAPEVLANTMQSTVESVFGFAPIATPVTGTS